MDEFEQKKKDLKFQIFDGANRILNVDEVIKEVEIMQRQATGMAISKDDARLLFKLQQRSIRVGRECSIAGVTVGWLMIRAKEIQLKEFYREIKGDNEKLVKIIFDFERPWIFGSIQSFFPDIHDNQQRRMRISMLLIYFILCEDREMRGFREVCVFLLGRVYQIDPTLDVKYNVALAKKSVKEGRSTAGKKRGEANRGRKVSHLLDVMRVLLSLIGAKSADRITNERELKKVLEGRIRDELDDRLRDKKISFEIMDGKIRIFLSGKKQGNPADMSTCLRRFRAAKKEFESLRTQ